MKQTHPDNFRSMDGNRLKAIIKDFLRERRYVLVFDDVWSIHPWEAIRYALPNENNGSRVILTTRFMDVASSCSKETDGYVHELNPLSEEDIKTSRMHDFYREIILPKSRDQNFVTSTNELEHDIAQKKTLSQVIIEEGAMPHLEKLIIQRCNSLEGVPEGIEHLVDLKVLEFFRYS
ncbi:hypothetical protein Fot_28221 [Forsythia ovata]|uniref:NB-ARC domain-containing protein n=1 Tax=Forsythia ovata TaxID=205694 RepID=A0ABD1TP81_9LAMI